MVELEKFSGFCKVLPQARYVTKCSLFEDESAIFGVSRVTPFASTELALKHTRNKLYTELVLQELALQE